MPEKIFGKAACEMLGAFEVDVVAGTPHYKRETPCTLAQKFGELPISCIPLACKIENGNAALGKRG